MIDRRPAAAGEAGWVEKQGKEMDFWDSPRDDI